MLSTASELQLTDQTLIAHAQTGSVRAFEILVRRYHPQILRYLTRQVGDRELAADLTQETFLDAFRHLDRLKDDRPFAAWLHGIAYYTMLHERRRRRLHYFLSLEWCLSREGAADRHLVESDTTAALPEHDLIQQVLATLSPNLRAALLLHSLCGFPGEQVAEVLGISAMAARQRISRAKEQFRLCYRALNGESDDPSL